jgi:Survival motor neuron (SMN) interacting protein 1 (SIP1)
MSRDKRRNPNGLRSGSKRVRVYSDAQPRTSGELDLESGQRSAFPTIQCTEVKGDVPLNPTDYIALVRSEAAKRPPFVWSSGNSLVVPAGRRTLKSYEDGVSLNSAPASGSKLVSQSGTIRTTLPYAIDSNWHFLFIEKFEHVKECALSVSAEGMQTPAVVIPDTMAKWRLFMLDDAHPPTLSLVKSFSVGTIVTLLGYQTKWISTRLSERFTQWIYSLLVCLPSVLEGKDIAILREMAKKSIKIRIRPDKPLDTNTCYALDMIISIVAGYYRQHDLAVIGQK